MILAALRKRTSCTVNVPDRNDTAKAREPPFFKAQKESAATLMRAADCKLRLDLVGLFAYGATCTGC